MLDNKVKKPWSNKLVLKSYGYVKFVDNQPDSAKE